MRVSDCISAVGSEKVKLKLKFLTFATYSTQKVGFYQ